MHIPELRGGGSKYIKRYLNGIQENGDASKFACPNCLKYQFTDDFKINISDKCCDKLKKQTSHRYEKESGRKIAILGLRTSEGGQREYKTQCVVFDKDRQVKRFKPINPCSNDFCEWYIKTRDIKLCKLYYPPYSFNRTGCKGCPFAIDLQAQLEVMGRLLPAERKQCEYIWKPIYEEYRRIGYRLNKNEQMKLF